MKQALEPEKLSPEDSRRILSIDGGGIKGTCPAAFLASLEEELDQPIGSYFDLIAGTSTGGILAIGLALGLPAKTLLELYENKGPEIFGQSIDRSYLRAFVEDKLAWLRHWVAPKHDADTLRSVLEDVLGDKCFSDAKTRLLIPAWNADARSVYIHKTAHHPRLVKDYKTLLIDAALGTAAAPSFYKQHRTVDQVGLLDGGVWANNPTGLATVEAIGVLEWDAKDLKILSLGCIDDVYTLPDSPGLLQLARKGRSLALFMDGQSKCAMVTAKILTGHPHDRQAVYRYEASAPKDLFTLDDTAKISRLKGLGHSMARKADPELKQVFFAKPAEPFEPLHTTEKAA